jgi:hypothetical protein
MPVRLALLAALLAACSAGPDDTDNPDFVAVTDITGVPDTVFTDVRMSLSGTAVEPANVTNKSIVWSWKNVGAADFVRVAGGQFMVESTTEGTEVGGKVSLRAQVDGGVGNGAVFSREYTLLVRRFVVVTNLDGVPKTGAADTAIDLAGVIVEPADSSFRTVTWAVTSGKGAVNGSAVTPQEAGELVITATVVNGALDDGALANYTQDFKITISVVLEGDTINFDPERALELSPANVNLSKTSAKTATFSVKSGLSGYEWYVDGVKQAGTARSFTLNADDYTLGGHFLTASALIDGVRYSQSMTFSVGP